MWIVRLALRRPYTFTVMAMLVVLLGIVTITRMSTDIFPNINIPVVKPFEKPKGGSSGQSARH
jgi:multidrug efflux pump subunit AcrB